MELRILRLALFVYIAGWTCLLVWESHTKRRMGWILFDVVMIVLAAGIVLESVLYDIGKSK